MTNLADEYKIPPEIATFIDSGFLELLSKSEAEKTIEFHMPSLRREDHQGRITAYTLTWIHPDYNAEFCHYYDEKPGDLPNFYVEIETSDVGNDQVDDLNSVDDLEVWLELTQEHAAS